MTFSWDNLYNSIPTALKWTAVADGLALVALTLNYVPTTIFGIPTLPFVTAISGVILTWEAYAQKQAGTTTSTTSGTGSTTTTTTTKKAVSVAPSKFLLDCNLKTPAIGSTFTISVEYGVSGGSFTIYEADNNQPVTVSYPLDANGNGNINVVSLNITTPLGFIISTRGEITIYAKDSADNVSNEITIS